MFLVFQYWLVDPAQALFFKTGPAVRARDCASSQTVESMSRRPRGLSLEAVTQKSEVRTGRRHICAQVCNYAAATYYLSLYVILFYLLPVVSSFTSLYYNKYSLLWYFLLFLLGGALLTGARGYFFSPRCLSARLKLGRQHAHFFLFSLLVFRMPSRNACFYIFCSSVVY